MITMIQHFLVAIMHATVNNRQSECINDCPANKSSLLNVELHLDRCWSLELVFPSSRSDSSIKGEAY